MAWNVVYSISTNFVQQMGGQEGAEMLVGTPTAGRVPGGGEYNAILGYTE